MGEKPLRIWFDNIDGFIRIDNGIIYLVLPNYSGTYDRIKYLISEKKGITVSIDHNFARIRIDSYNYLPVEKILNFHVIILIKSVVNGNKNHYYYNIFLEKKIIHKSKINPIHNIFK